ncbi:hypothetical protein [Eleftheria terrae]|uniref:hypothetical protein n=1 Tax=Eleftheria terrae TaxID=1597781 RepID=UPI00263B3B0F|nr:hypothetical protein [Eleftheria terrae]WKB50770.1 hypothetical protein N7L95_13180 [Eleftheria terrae]
MWPQLIVWIATTVLSALLAPKPKSQDAQPGQIGDKDLPIASQDAPIPVLFGTRVISGPNVVWYGDVQVKPIKKKGGGKK